MSANTQPGFFRRFWRALIRLLAVVAVLAILAAAAVAGYFGFLEIQRSFDNVTFRMAANEQRIDLLRSDVDELMDQELARELTSLQSRVEEVASDVDTLQSELESDLAAQSETLSALTTGVEAATTMSSTVSTELADLNASLAALQGDINENGSRIDDLGGEIDALDGSVTMVESDLATIQAKQATVAPVQETLALFRVWELITRARFRLLENNAGLATNDVTVALETMQRLMVASSEETAVSLQAVETRLALALDSLPNDPEMAAADLENAWDELDVLLANRVLPPLPAPEDAESPDSAAAEGTTSPTPTSTAAEEGTPTPTPTEETTPTPTATEEATPTP